MVSSRAAGVAPAEPYQSLYRRYRPQRFADVPARSTSPGPCCNAVRDGKVAHAYLFSGPRGTGKTSTARILAMALNCEHPVDGEPDGTCPSCVAIRRGSSLDVQELDAASNRKLDEMRDLLSRVALGTRGRWKVYIIDEVHQLTSDAASALLKTLEEPPAHVVFVLATTDPQKVLPTIRSRTQHFEFRLLASDVLGELLRDVNERGGARAWPPRPSTWSCGGATARPATPCRSSTRWRPRATVEDEATVVGEIVDALADRDPGRVLLAVAEAHVGRAGCPPAGGRHARAPAQRVPGHPGPSAGAARPTTPWPRSRRRPAGSAAGLVRAMEVIGQALTDMRDSVDPRITLEVALVRLAQPEADTRPRRSSSGWSASSGSSPRPR